MAIGVTWPVAAVLGGFARGGEAPGFLGPLLGMMFLLLVLIAMKMWFNRLDKS